MAIVADGLQRDSDDANVSRSGDLPRLRLGRKRGQVDAEGEDDEISRVRWELPCMAISLLRELTFPSLWPPRCTDTYLVQPNAGAHLRLEAGATQERTL